MGLVPARRPGWLLERRGNPSPRGMAAQSRLLGRDGQNPAYRPSGFCSPAKAGVQNFLSDRAPAFAGADTASIGSNDGSAEEIGRLGISPLALVRRQGPSSGPRASVRSRWLQRNRRPPSAQGSEQPRALVLLRSARGRIQQEL